MAVARELSMYRLVLVGGTRKTLNKHSVFPFSMEKEMKIIN
jgi:hypothetical protein